MAILVQIGIAFGFFIGCSVFESITKPNPENDAPPTETELEQRLDTIERQLSENPENAETYYQKGGVLNRLAHKQPAPDDRSGYYEEMRDALLQSAAIFDTSANRQGVEKVDELLKVSWSFEHNRGVEILQTEGTIDSSDFNRAAAHFNNAIIIIPDSVVSYKMKAQAHYRNHQVDMAVNTLETAYNRIDRLPSSVLEQLAFLYLEEKQQKKATMLYEEAESFSDQSLNLIHGLANAYITAGRHAKAVELLQALVEREPENIIYLESYGTELYELGMQTFDSLQTISASDTTTRRQLLQRANGLLDRATTRLEEARDQNQDKIELKKQLATIYQNSAARLKQVKQAFGDRLNEEIKQRIESQLSSAIPLLEELVEEDPDQSQQYWQQLYRAYSNLDMQQKATEAKAKANL